MFREEADYLATVLQRRDKLVKGCVKSGISFLDDALGGIYPDDFMVLGADTGVGKTELIVTIVDSALGQKHAHPAHALMLEADEGEITARLGFQRLALRGDRRFDYSDFWRGRAVDQEQKHWKDVMAELQPKLSQLQTFYKTSGNFTPGKLEKILRSIGNATRMVAVDHLHMVEGSGTENDTQQRTAELLRDYALVNKRPVVAAAHLRKKGQNEQRELVPDKDNIMGSKHILGKSTVIVMVARHRDSESPAPHLCPTLFRIAKDRRGRQVHEVARVYYNMETGKYQDSYVLGRVRWHSKDRRQLWEPVPETYLPKWAVRDARRKQERPF